MAAIKHICWLILCCCGVSAVAQTVYVSTAAQLQSALNSAVPGETISIQDGYYERSGGFYANAGIDGTSNNPITVIGSRNVVLSTNNLLSGYAFSLKGNKYWVIKGFTVTNSKNGVVLDSCKYVTIDSIQSKKTGQDGIHLRTYSSYCTVKNCYIDSTGLNDYSYGEGIYIGSAYSNWCTYTDCNPDTSNYNQILNNRFGSFITAENIDIKEGTKYGYISGNTFNGSGLQNMNGGDSWIDAKGNYYTIENNVGNNSILDGYQTHIAQPGWGNYNTFRNNTINVNGPGYGVRVQTSNSNGTANNNVVCTSNTVSGAALGLTNISTTNCNTVFPVSLLSWSVAKNNGQLHFEWALTGVAGIREFVIESGSDGHTFTALQKIGVAGLTYTERLTNRVTTNMYFRLAMVNNDGSVSYSKTVRLPNEWANLQVQRNGSSVAVIFPAPRGSLVFYNSAGQKLADHELVYGYNFLTTPPQCGIAFLRISDGLATITRSLLLR